MDWFVGFQPSSQWQAQKSPFKNGVEHVAKEDIAKYQDLLNNRPRKILDFNTPILVFLHTVALAAWIGPDIKNVLILKLLQQIAGIDALITKSLEDNLEIIKKIKDTSVKTIMDARLAHITKKLEADEQAAEPDAAVSQQADDTSDLLADDVVETNAAVEIGGGLVIPEE